MRSRVVRAVAATSHCGGRFSHQVSPAAHVVSRVVRSVAAHGPRGGSTSVRHGDTSSEPRQQQNRKLQPAPPEKVKGKLIIDLYVCRLLT